MISNLTQNYNCIVDIGGKTDIPLSLTRSSEVEIIPIKTILMFEVKFAVGTEKRCRKPLRRKGLRVVGQ